MFQTDTVPVQATDADLKRGESMLLDGKEGVLKRSVSDKRLFLKKQR